LAEVDRQNCEATILEANLRTFAEKLAFFNNLMRRK
jgi:hypothetical protein